MSDTNEILTKIKVFVAQHLAISCVVSFLLILLAGYFTLFSSQVYAIRSAERTAALEDEVKAKQAYHDSLVLLISNYASVPQEQKNRIDSMLPTQADVPGILATVEALANNALVGVDSMAFSTSDAGPLSSVPGLAAVNVSLSVGHCDFERFELFLDSLEKNLRIFDVKSMSMVPSASNYNLTFRTYYRTK